MHAVKVYEQLTIEAAITGDRGIAAQALVHHPLVPSVIVAKRCSMKCWRRTKVLAGFLSRRLCCKAE